MTPNILVLGKDGLLGQALLQRGGAQSIGFGRTDCDFADADFIDAIATQHRVRPLTAICNAAAYTAVDEAECEDAALLLRINAQAVGQIAAWCVDHDVALVHFSSDYVFDGGGERPWQEADRPAPLNAYGRSKFAGEQAILEAHPRALIVRTSWLYDSRGVNFFTRICELLQTNDSLHVVDDQIGAPTYVPHFAAAAMRALESALRAPVFPTGIYHLCHQGETSWHGFACAIRDGLVEAGVVLRCEHITPVRSKAFGAAALRPLNSRLDCRHIHDSLDIWLPDWQVGLRDCLALRSLVRE